MKLLFLICILLVGVTLILGCISSESSNQKNTDGIQQEQAGHFSSEKINKIGDTIVTEDFEIKLTAVRKDVIDEFESYESFTSQASNCHEEDGIERFEAPPEMSEQLNLTPSNDSSEIVSEACIGNEIREYQDRLTNPDYYDSQNELRQELNEKYGQYADKFLYMECNFKRLKTTNQNQYFKESSSDMVVYDDTLFLRYPKKNSFYFTGLNESESWYKSGLYSNNLSKINHPIRIICSLDMFEGTIEINWDSNQNQLPKLQQREVNAIFTIVPSQI